MTQVIAFRTELFEIEVVIEDDGDWYRESLNVKMNDGVITLDQFSAARHELAIGGKINIIEAERPSEQK